MKSEKLCSSYSPESDKNNITSLESFIEPENYIDYFDKKIPLTIDAKYSDNDSEKEVNRLVHAFNALKHKSSDNKDTFNNLLNLSYCRATQYNTFNYYDINSYPELILKAVDDINSDSEFINRLIKKITFNEIENTPIKEHMPYIADNPRAAFMKDYVNFGPDYRRLYREVVDYSQEIDDVDLLYSPGGETLNEHYVELEVLSLFGVNITDVSEASRGALFDWGVNLTRDKYDRLKKIAKPKTYTNRVEMANAFLATEFGDDFGDYIVDIAEYSKENESDEIFEIINEYRDVSRSFSSQFNDIDPGFSLGAEKAMNERLTDLLAVAAEVSKNGSLTADVAPHRGNEDYVHDGKFDIKIDSLDQIIDTMNSFLKSQKMLSDILSSKDTCIINRYKKDVDKVYSQTYSLINDKFGIAQFHVRRFGAGSFDKTVEHGNYNGTEATISWSISPNNPFAYPGSKDPDCMNVRFDREGRLIDEAPDSPGRSSIRDDGVISLDIGSVLGEKTSVSTVVGRTIAAGNIIRAESDNGINSISLNHNTNYLSQEYGNANDFAWLATMIEQKIVNSYEHANKKNIIKIGKTLVKKSVDASYLVS
ncbi:hypothetical protein CVV43_01235 [Candidatus Saccharibacteria bacterium HGW-Saccharibacteria-1]|jgi:hypothetical protein|nr:MAG: hypothetical protein CVV43_01235 [Candidatus Saccharibacteria bacterium HGW-Saccharibacteria-1]